MKKYTFFFLVPLTVALLTACPVKKALADFALYFGRNELGMPIVRIKATYYIKKGDVSTGESARYAAQFWNKQTGRFLLRLGTKKSQFYYIVLFDLKIQETDNPEYEMKKDKSFAADAGIKDGSSNCFEVVDDADLANCGETRAANFIRIRRSKRNDCQAAAHEMGHSLFMHDENPASPSVMAGANTEVNDVLNGDLQQSLFTALNSHCINKVTVHDEERVMADAGYLRVSRTSPAKMKRQREVAALAKL